MKLADTYLGAEHYLDNFIIAEQKEQYRINSFWHSWWYRGLIAAKEIDSRIVESGWRIIG